MSLANLTKRKGSPKLIKTRDDKRTIDTHTTKFQKITREDFKIYVSIN
jgi:hypothetical protein